MGSQTVDKAMEILSLFLEGPEVGVMEATRRLGMDKSTVSRLFASLEAAAMVVADPLTRRYRLGTRVLHLANALYEQLDVRRIALPEMVRLRDACDETVSLQRRIGDARVCIEQVQSRQGVRRVVEVGQPLPLYAGSSGKLLLSQMADEEIDAFLRRLSPDPPSANFPSPESLRQEIHRIRSVGYAISLDERVAGMSGISAPVRDYRGEVVAALAISGPSVRWTQERMQSFVGQLLTGAAEVSSDLGYRAELPVAARPRP